MSKIPMAIEESELDNHNTHTKCTIAQEASKMTPPSREEVMTIAIAAAH
jgi:hypothetical protein